MVLDLRYQQRDIRWEMRLRVRSGVTQASESTQESLIVNKPRPTTSTDVDRFTWAHRCRNLLAKVGAEAQRELRDAYWAIFDTDDLIAASIAPGPKLVAAVQQRIDAVAAQYGHVYPAAVKCLLADREQLTSYLRFPVEHHRRIRHSNFIERTFGETRRRVKVIGRLPGETSCLSLVWAVLDRASEAGAACR